MTVIKRKAFAYITHGHRLLVFSHPLAPDAGNQVPAGTIRDGERSEDAAMREAAEETGRNDLVLVRAQSRRSPRLYRVVNWNPGRTLRAKLLA